MQHGYVPIKLYLKKHQGGFGQWISFPALDLKHWQSLGFILSVHCYWINTVLGSYPNLAMSSW
jgi:hypothetical protein